MTHRAPRVQVWAMLAAAPNLTAPAPQAGTGATHNPETGEKLSRKQRKLDRYMLL